MLHVVSDRQGTPVRAPGDRGWVAGIEPLARREAAMTYVIAEPCIGTKDNSCVEVCPVDAIFAEDQLPEEWQHFTRLNAEHYATAR
jgi:NAD-dependent dihydropyrimidine dehydrogenase PreA subunit